MAFCVVHGKWLEFDRESVKGVRSYPVSDEAFPTATFRPQRLQTASLFFYEIFSPQTRQSDREEHLAKGVRLQCVNSLFRKYGESVYCEPSRKEIAHGGIRNGSRWPGRRRTCPLKKPRRMLPILPSPVARSTMGQRLH
jgi:hypothetical protein